MKIGKELQNLRRLKGLTQEELAEYLGVTRQSISKWERDEAYPETEKLIRLSKLYQVTLDSLISPKTDRMHQSSSGYHYEYKSKRMLFGLPIVHINIGKGKRVAKGIISIGNISMGLFSLGAVSTGLVSFGILSCGLVAIGVLSLGVLLSVGAIAIGSIAIGAIAFGLFSIGAIAIGYFTVGAVSIGKYVALGDYAQGFIAIGKTSANGTHAYTPPIDKQIVIDQIDAMIPKRWHLFIQWIKLFIRQISF